MLTAPAVGIQDLYSRYQSVLKPLLRVGPVFGGIAILLWRVP